MSKSIATHGKMSIENENETLIEAFIRNRISVDGVRKISAVTGNRPAIHGLRDFIGERSLREATDDDYIDYLATRRAQPKTFNTQLVALQIFRKFLGLKKLAVKRVRVPKPKPIDVKAARVITDKILVAADKDYEKVLVILLSYGGMSREDVCAVKRENFIIGEDHVILNYNRIKTDTEASVLFIEKQHVIADYINSMPLALKSEKQEEQPLFLARSGRRTGEQLSPSGVSEIIARLSKKAGVYWHPHMFRHLVATEMALKNYSKFDLDATLGWRMSSNTASNYVNPTQKAIIEKRMRNEGIAVENEQVDVAKCWRCGMLKPGARCERCGAMRDAKKTLEEEKAKEDRIDVLQTQLTSVLDILAKMTGTTNIATDVKTKKLFVPTE